MPWLRLAHFSDIHYTLSPAQAWPASATGKRLAGSFAYFWRGLGARFRGHRERIAALLEDIDALGVDHALCTGDLTTTALDAELSGLAELFGPRLERPDRYTLIPGNHDRYVHSAADERRFERALGSLVPGGGGGFPAVKALPRGARLVALDPCRPTGWMDSSGLCGREQLARARALLEEDTRSPTVVCLHYGLLRHSGRLDRPRHGLRDAPELIELLDASPARIALVLHGHMHRPFTVSTAARTVICAGSAVDLASDAGYFVYQLDLDSLAVRVERRVWSPGAQRYVPADAGEYQAAIDARRGYRLPRL